MLFHTWTFAIFFIVVYTVYLAVRRTRFQDPWLLAASWVFYGWWNPLYLILIASCTIMDWGLVVLMGRAKTPGRRRLWLIVSIAANPQKGCLFTIREREQMVRELLKDYHNVSVDSFDTLAIDHVRRHNANVILRGIRTVSDFEFEFQMALTNRTMDPGIETVFVMSDEKYSFIRSSLIKEVARLGGSVKDMVPPLVAKALLEKLGTK